MKILVIGDTCIDKFVYGRCDRLCPEAPIPVLNPTNIITNPGMAGNVARNLVSLGADVDLIANDEVIEKTRYVDEHTNQMFVRVDTEPKIKPIGKNLYDIDFHKYDTIVISDYNKGFLEHSDYKKITSRHGLVFADTKKILSMEMEELSFIKFNTAEQWQNWISLSPEEYRIFADKIITTKGKNGCEFRKVTYPVAEVEIKDVAGAGDTFMAGLVYWYVKTEAIIEAIHFANECATKVVQHKGVVSI
ncbi:MAG: hypothetical protein KKB59_19725 [Spirochaetes bacterium]|nr:hypothetical protein [Spirochaetota bacterium]